jgi:hypothetical protein
MRFGLFYVFNMPRPPLSIGLRAVVLITPDLCNILGPPDDERAARG